MGLTADIGAHCRHFIGKAETAFLLSSLTVAATHLRFANKDALEEIYRVISPGGTFGMIWVNLSYGSGIWPSRSYADSEIRAEH